MASNGERYSTSCKPQDRAQAWSVDCGVAQINFPGYKSCPDYAYSLSYSLKRAQEKYAGRGNTWLAWSTYNNGAYLRHLTKQ